MRGCPPRITQIEYLRDSEVELSDEDMEDFDEPGSDEEDEGGAKRQAASDGAARPSRRRRGVEIEYEEEREQLGRVH